MRYPREQEEGHVSPLRPPMKQVRMAGVSECTCVQFLFASVYLFVQYTCALDFAILSTGIPCILRMYGVCVTACDLHIQQ